MMYKQTLSFKVLGFQGGNTRTKGTVALHASCSRERFCSVSDVIVAGSVGVLPHATVAVHAGAHCRGH
eukprot:645989-Amphidinium_carterae.3